MQQQGSVAGHAPQTLGGAVQADLPLNIKAGQAGSGVEDVAQEAGQGLVVKQDILGAVGNALR